MKIDLQDGLLLAGVALVISGIAHWSIAAAAIVLGGMCLLSSLAIAHVKQSGKDKDGSALK